MLQPTQSSVSPQKYPATPATYTPITTGSAPLEQATIGRSLVIKGEITGSEPLYIDGRVEGKINFAEGRITIGRNGHVAANVVAKELVIMGTVNGNVDCSDRLEIRGEGSVTGDVVTKRISVENGAQMKGSVEVRAGAKTKEDHVQAKPAATETPKAAAAAAGAGN
jgi:cytoskeletal protein CcmA (bactofilin family)